MRQDKQKLTNLLAMEYVKLTNISLKSIREPKQKFTGNFFNIIKKTSKIIGCGPFCTNSVKWQKNKMAIFPPTHNPRTSFWSSNRYCQYLLPYQKWNAWVVCRQRYNGRDRNDRKISEVRYKNDVARSFAFTLTKIIDYI